MLIAGTASLVVHQAAAAAPPAPDDWINSAEVAHMLQCSVRHVTEYLVTVATFPRPIRPPTAGKGRGHMRWPRSVIELYKSGLVERKKSAGGRPRRVD